MVDYKPILGAASVLLAVVGYGIYFRQIFSGKIKPHAFTWLLWVLTTGTVFAAQIVKHAGPGAWLTGFLCLACFAIFVTALYKGYRNFVTFDWLFLAAAFVSLLLWWLTKEPTIAVILITITDALATLPTIRKSYNKPYEESAILFALNSLRSIIALYALEVYVITTWIYPAMLVVFNGLIVLVILTRRYNLRQTMNV